MNIMPYHFSQAPATILIRIHQNDGIFSAISRLIRQEKCSICEIILHPSFAVLFYLYGLDTYLFANFC